MPGLPRSPFGDGAGHVVPLFERDCTLQRRHQKVIEEAPAWGLPRALLDQIASDAVKLGESLNYRGLGTVEFLVAGDDYFFLEVNPRIQVEHPVTEAITGLDLVALQLRIAQGAGLGLAQADITCTGHAVEARLYAEDPANSFAPSTGKITTLSLPEGIRIDSGVAPGDEVSPFYDPMIAKLIVHAANRETALARLAEALDHTIVVGVQTNRSFLTALARNPEFAGMNVHTRWIDTRLDALTTPPADATANLWRAVAAVLFVSDGRNDNTTNPWGNRSNFTGWRLNAGDALVEAGQRVTLMGSEKGAKHEELRVGPIGPGGFFTVFDANEVPLSLTCLELEPGRWRVTHNGETLMLEARITGDAIEITTVDARRLFHAAPPLAFAGSEGAAERMVESPLTGMIVDVVVSEGDLVAEGDVIAVMESMKMEISIKAAAAGIATNISVTKGMMVDRGQTIAEIAPNEGEPK